MMRVTVAVNGRTIAEVTATNRGAPKDKITQPGDRVYELPDGTTLEHNRERGPLRLARRLIEHVPEVTCERCKGSGTVRTAVEGVVTAATRRLTTCPACEGAGSVPAWEGDA